MAKVTHLVLTRFNCRFHAAWTSVAIERTWLGPRFELFERYCLPSVSAQNTTQFKWIIFFDDETPDPFKSRALGLASAAVHPVFVKTLTSTLIRNTIREHIDPKASHVITSRLDNDDGLASDYIQRIGYAFEPKPFKEYLNITEGLILSNGRLYRRRDPHNAFVSLIEPVDGVIEGVWTYPHPDIGQHAPVRQIGCGPGWLQVVHGANVSNKVRGKRVPPEALGDKFVLDRSELLPAGGMNYWWERNVMSAAWAGRDLAAAAARAGKRAIGRGWKPS